MINKKKIIISVLVLLFVFIGAYFYFNKDKQDKVNVDRDVKVSDRKYDSNIAEISESIFNDDDALFSYVKRFGPQKTIKYLNQLSAKFGSCHNSAHRAGHFAYEIYNEESFKLCSGECHSGCYHGATEAYFRDHGTADLHKNLNLLCNSELNGFFTHQCIHGIGHGLMAWTNYELPEALTSCDLLSQGRESCWTGVFMENIVGGLSKSDVDKGGDSEHFTKYLSDDPQYPCNTVEAKYKGACYFLQTSRMMQLYYGDFKRIADACSKAEQPYQSSCFGSMGRDVGGSNPHNPEGSIIACSNVPEGNYRIDCLLGAVQDSMWDPTGQDDALKFCRLLTKKEEKNGCYNTIFGRATEIFTSNQDLKIFCSKAESEYQAICPKNII